MSGTIRYTTKHEHMLVHCTNEKNPKLAGIWFDGGFVRASNGAVLVEVGHVYDGPGVGIIVSGEDGSLASDEYIDIDPVALKCAEWTTLRSSKNAAFKAKKMTEPFPECEHIWEVVDGAKNAVSLFVDPNQLRRACFGMGFGTGRNDDRLVMMTVPIGTDGRAIKGPMRMSLLDPEGRTLGQRAVVMPFKTTVGSPQSPLGTMISELEAKVAELEAKVAELKAEINQLHSELDTIEDETMQNCESRFSKALILAAQEAIALNTPV